MKKVNIFLVMCMVLFSLNLVLAQDDVVPIDSKNNDLKCLDCGDECVPADQVAAMMCQPPTNGKPRCGFENGVCVVMDFDTSEGTSDEEFMTDWDGTCGDIDCDKVEIVSPGITPDSNFYFIDEFFDNFGDEINNREERVAEIKSMIEAGNYEAAHKALKKYKEYAKKLEAESDPEKRDEARRSAAAIKNALDEIKNDIPENEKDDFYNGIIDSEKGLLTAVDISSKIKELCVQLAELDPVQYSKTCRSEGDSPKWKKDLDKDLTEEQRKEAKEFGKIMSQCFKTSGKDCNCEGINFYDFSVACSKVAPLASKCDAGSEDACRMMDEIEMPELPDYLEDVLEDIENQYGEDKYDMYMPKECVDAGVTSPKECGRIMIKENAPIECRQALLDADVESEREGREICDKIMMEKHAPECVKEGIIDPEKCKDFMDNNMGPRGPNDMGPPGQNCMQIEDKMKRLDCFEGAVGDMGNRYGVGEKFEDGNMGEITWQCKENRIHWGPDCEKFMREEWPQQEIMRNEEQSKEWEQKDDWRIMEKECADSCGDRWDFSNGRCICTTEDHDYIKEGEWEVRDDYDGSYEESECKDGCSQECGDQNTDCVNDRCVCLGGEDEGFEDYDDYELSEPITSLEPISEPEPTLEPEPTSEPEPSSEPAPITGEVVGNEFLDYYKR